MGQVDAVFTSDELEHICYELMDDDGASGEYQRFHELVHGWHQLHGTYRIEAVVVDDA